MEKSKCTHIRIRDDNDYSLDAEDIIKSIEREFNIDFRSLPQWKELIKRIQVSRTDCKRRIQYANLQKANVIGKLYMQSIRQSPFELTDELARTASKWRQMKNDQSKRKVSLIPESSTTTAFVEIDEEVGEELTAHPNTENYSSESVQLVPSKVEVAVQHNAIPDKEPINNLPVVICTNSHKLLSPLGSRISSFSFQSVHEHIEPTEESAIKEHQTFASSVICNPTPIIITDNKLKPQSVTFSLTNCSAGYLHIRFKNITDYSPFKKIKLLPVIPKRLYPGIPVVFKLIFQLNNKDDIKTSLYFRIGCDVYIGAPTEPLFVPIVSKFKIQRSVKVSEVVTIPPVYPWHIKIGPESEYPTGVLKISVEDSYSYHVHICKREVNFGSEIFSTKALPPSTESMAENGSFSSRPFVRTLHQSNTATENSENSESGEMTVSEMMAIIAYDIVQLALDVFVFECSCFYLHSHAKRQIAVYLTKAEHIGYHQSYYDVILIDTMTDTVVMTKTVKVFAEVLQHPIQISPPILDMTYSLLCHGYFEDRFTITNNHTLYPVTVYINLTTKMKKLMYISPMKCVVPTSSSITFDVKFCSRAYLSTKPCEDLVHFTFKITVVGYKTVYANVPPIFYELILPCALEFKKVYNEKYFKEES